MNKTALITGASSGIGEQLARIHAGEKGNLILVARNEKKLAEMKMELCERFGVSVEYLVKDLSVAGAAQDVFHFVQQKQLVVDYLINNAGFGGVGLFYERARDQDVSMIQLNVVVLTELCRLFLPAMVKRNHGRILNVSSTASLLPGPRQAVYYATKAYVTSLSNAIAEELRETNVTVTALMPGATDTKFGKVSGMDKTSLFKKTASPAKVASDGYAAMLQGKLNCISGITVAQRIMFMFLPFLPKKLLLRQVHEMQKPQGK